MDTKIKTAKTVVIYARVSTDDQDCDRQVRDLREYAERCGYDVVATFTETGSGMKVDRAKRNKVMELARQRRIDAVLVTEMTRWGRSTIDLLDTLQTLHSYGVSIIAQTGLDFDLSTPQGKLLATIFGGLAEFERNLIAERTRSGLAAARARGKQIGRQVGQNPSDKYAKRVMAFIAEGRSVRWVAKELQISKTTVMNIKKRHVTMSVAK